MDPREAFVHRTKGARVAAIVALTWVFVAGMAMYLEGAFGLRRFGGIEYVPRVVALSVTRFWGAWGAAVAVYVVVTGVLHDRTAAAAPGSTERWRARARASLVAAVSVVVLYLPACLVSLAGTLLLASTLDGLGPRTFIPGLQPDDLVRGASWSVAFGVVPAAWVLFGQRIWGAPWRLWVKIVVTYVVLFGVGLVLGALGSLDA